MPAISQMVKAKGYKVPFSMVQYLELHNFTVEDAEAAVQQFVQIGYWEKDGSAWGEKSPVPEAQPSSSGDSQAPPVAPAPEPAPSPEPTPDPPVEPVVVVEPAPEAQ